MTVDFGIRLSRYPENPGEDAHDYYERTLDSLSEHITTVWLSDHLQDGDVPNFESWVLMAHLAALDPRFRYSLTWSTARATVIPPCWQRWLQPCSISQAGGSS
jgi:hypothetical protein